MIALDYQGRYKPCFEATLDELFETVEAMPMHGPGSRLPGLREGWLYLSTLYLNRADFIHYYAKVKPALVEMISRRSIFETDGINLPEHHGLEIQERDGGMFLAVKFQLVSGSYTLVKLEREVMLAMLDKAREEI